MLARHNRCDRVGEDAGKARNGGAVEDLRVGVALRAEGHGGNLAAVDGVQSGGEPNGA